MFQKLGSLDIWSSKTESLEWSQAKREAMFLVGCRTEKAGLPKPTEDQVIQVTPSSKH